MEANNKINKINNSLINSHSTMKKTSISRNAINRMNNNKIILYRISIWHQK